MPKVAQIANPTPAANFEAEQSVLGAILVDPQKLALVSDVLTAEDFYRPDHKKIYQVMLDLDAKNEPVDLVTVTNELRRQEQLDAVGGPVFVAALSEQVGFASNVEHYAKLVADQATIRRLEEAGRRVVAACQRRPKEVDKLLDWSEQQIFKVGGTRASLDMAALGDTAALEYEALSKLWEGVRPLGLLTGFTDYDRLLAGLQPGDENIIAARPSMGKTALALNIALNVGIRGIPVAFFSLEMSKEQLTRRALASIAKIDAELLKTGKLSGDDWAKLNAAVETFTSSPVHIFDKPSATTTEIRGASRRLAQKVGQIGLVIIDYLQLVKWAGRAGNREREVAEISGALKSLARELHCPLLALCQLNRDLEKRPNKRPILSDLRESGAIEQDADSILFLYRDEVYNEDSKAKGICECALKKQRNGPTGKFNLTYQDKYTRFDNNAVERLF